jgi:hypothetical protein
MEMNEKDAFQVIEKMIASAKREVKENGFYFMFWGWLVFIAALIDYSLLKGVIPALREGHAITWAILMPLGGIVTMIKSIKDRKREPAVKTYIDELMRYAVRAFAISLFIVCGIMPMSENWSVFYPVLLIIYAIWLYIAGGALRFKPLIWGSYANWAFAIVAFFVQYDNQLLLLAGAVLVGYIIPGHQLKSNYDKQHVQRA